MKSRFISVEGGEGVGKSLFIELLHAGLVAMGIGIVRTREPGGTPVAMKIRELFSSPPSADPLLMETELMLISAARAQHTQHLIKPKMLEGQWVLTDRYADSTRVYQGYVGGLSPAFVEGVIAVTTFGLEPDLTFVLDCDPATSMQRLTHRLAEGQDGAARYDHSKFEFHSKIRQGFIHLAQEFPKRLVVLDASADAESVANQGIQIVKERLLD